MNVPNRLERKFGWEGKSPGVQFLEVRPGKVGIPGFGLMGWHDAQRLGEELLRASRDSRFMSELREQQAVDIRLVCTQCEEPFAEGIVTVEDTTHPGQRRRHVEGSPACAR
jgi:hypothetical protein